LRVLRWHGKNQAAAGWGKSFPTIGNFFSNHWKNGGNFFQSLETIFPIIGKL
jgi:hypothetical protein